MLLNLSFSSCCYISVLERGEQLIMIGNEAMKTGLMFLALISMIFIQFIPLYELGNQKNLVRMNLRGLFDLLN